MDDQTTSTGFGRYLQSIRLAKKIGLEKVSAETRIGLGTLRHIEQEALDALPAEVFLKGFLRAYAKYIEADPDEAVRRYEAHREVAIRIARFEKTPQKLSSGAGLKLLLSLVALGLLMAASIAGMDYRHGSVTVHGTAAETKPAGLPQASEAAAEKPMQGRVPPADQNAAVDGLVLKVTAADATWLKIIIDQGEAHRYLLKKGEEMVFRARSAYSLLVGDAGRIRLEMNGQPVTVAGSQGDIVALQLP